MKELLNINQIRLAVAFGATISLTTATTRYLSAKFPNNKIAQRIQEGQPNNSSFSDDIKFGAAFTLMALTYGVIFNGVRMVIK